MTATPSANMTFQTPRLNHHFGTFDEFGLMVGLRRLPGEKNLHYFNRLYDVGQNRPHAGREGLHNAICRSLSIKPWYNAISFKAGTVGDSESTQYVDKNANLEISQTGIFYDSDELIIVETQVVDPVNWEITLDEYPRYQEDVVLKYGDDVIDTNLYTVNTVTKLVKFTDDTYSGLTITAQYNYRKYFPFYTTWPTSITIAALNAQIDAFKTPPVLTGFSTFPPDDIMGASLYGVVLGVNTDASNNIYASGVWTGSYMQVSLYKDSGLAADDLVGYGEVASSAHNVTQHIEIEERNSSGITGSIVVYMQGASFTQTLTYSDGYKYIVMDVLDTDVNSEPAHRILYIPPVQLTRKQLLVNVYPLRLLELWDPLLKELITNSYGHLYNTDYEGWSEAIAAQASIFWEDCVFNVSGWDLLGRRELDVLPHLWDNKAARFLPELPSASEYSHSAYVYLGGYMEDGYIRINRSGTTNNDYKSGIGFGNSLKVIDLVEVTVERTYYFDFLTEQGAALEV